MKITLRVWRDRVGHSAAGLILDRQPRRYQSAARARHHRYRGHLADGQNGFVALLDRHRRCLGVERETHFALAAAFAGRAARAGGPVGADAAAKSDGEKSGFVLAHRTGDDPLVGRRRQGIKPLARAFQRIRQKMDFLRLPLGAAFCQGGARIIAGLEGETDRSSLHTSGAWWGSGRWKDFGRPCRR